MKSSKERKSERKMARERMTARKTEESRARRLANKAKRLEIISINPEAKIDIINQETYVDGVRVEILNNKIVPMAFEDAVVEYLEVKEQEIMKTNGKMYDVIDNIKTKNKSAIERLTDKLRRNK